MVLGLVGMRMGEQRSLRIPPELAYGEKSYYQNGVNIPPRATVRIAWMPDDRPGSWMYHCHILEHHASGMMAHFDTVR